jgi:DNA-binding transcriptional ArsR family regulator
VVAGRPKNSKQLERHLKGVANHWRIDILLVIAARPGITLEEITDHLSGNEKTISEHTRRLAQAGLVDKKYQGRTVAHTLSPYGKIFWKFITTFQHS